jgi:lipopolysaccharide biosynthesis glycosyltransferase
MLHQNWHRYFNAGVLVFNIQKFKAKIPLQSLLKFAIYYTSHYKNHMADQDILNLFIEDDYYVLSPEWNNLWFLANEDGCIINQPSKPDTRIVHYASSIKPWKDGTLVDNNIDALEWRKLAGSVPLFRELDKKYT